MGVRNLNRIFKNNCANTEAIKRIPLSELKGKKIAIDTSIYLYKFKLQGLLLKFYEFCSVMRHYDIIPIFVFDGKPPMEKKEEIKKRKEKKKEAETKIIELETIVSKMGNTDDDKHRKNEIEDQIDYLKTQSIYISKNNIEDVKKLMRSLGVSYIDAPSEAEKLCAYLYHTKQVHGCLSEDMDLFLYGVNNVYRYLSLYKNEVVQYDLNKILEKIDLTQHDLMSVCILSGCDYTDNTRNLYSLINSFKKIKNTDEIIYKDDFIDWFQVILSKNNVLDDECKDKKIILENTYNMFMINFEEFVKYKNIPIITNDIDIRMCRKFLDEKSNIFIV